MKFKTLILVILGGIVVGIGIIAGEQLLKPKGIQLINIVRHQINSLPSESTPTPKPTLPPLDQNTNLEEEINNLIPPDFSEDFNNLRNSLN